MTSFLQTLRYAARTLLHSPAYTLAALLSLGLGIGANTAIFTLTNAVFLHPLPVKDPSAMIELYQVDHATHSTVANLTRTALSYPNFVDLRDQNDVFTGMAGFTQAGVTLTGAGKPLQQNVFLATANYFDLLGIQAAVGRVFRPDEDRLPGGNAVAVLSYSLWQRLYGGDRAAIGRTIVLNTVAYEVIGVAPPNFKGTLTVGPPDVVWVPLSMHTQVLTGPAEQFFHARRMRFLSAFARLKPGVDERRALASMQTIFARLEAEYPADNRGRSVETSPLSQAALGFLPRGQTTAAAVALSGAVGFVLLIACANIANLSLARATKRSREMGIRVALGASRSSLVFQLLTEAELLSLAGGLLGIAVGWAGAQLLWSLRPSFLAQSSIDLQLDLRVCAFTLGVSVLTGILFGLAPVFRASATDIASVLNTGGRGNIQGGSRNRLRSVLVVCEMALAMVALAGAGLFIRSMQNAQRIDLGFDTRDLCLVAFDLGSERMTPQRGLQFTRSVLERVSAVPGVAAAAVADTAPLQGGFLQTAFHEGDPVDSRLGTLVLTGAVTPGFFDTWRIPLVEGRLLNSFDRAGTRPVAVISEAMAHRFWPGQKAAGKRFHFATAAPGGLIEVVGVVKQTTVLNIGEVPQPVVYMPWEQDYQPFAVLAVRASVPPERLLPAVTAAVQSLDPDLALLNPSTMQQIIGQALWAPRIAAALFGLFGLLGTVLAVIGVYGVMAYMVLQRTSEIGIRMAMGARAPDVIRIVVGQSLRLAAVGIVAGLCAALALTRLVADLLFDVSPNDPLTFAAVACILAATALAAGGIPAWRAARIDPVRALRQE
ncbi:MAG TPA: ABC transporter permease [Bryobacteraceae bacterium]|jgi:predicted permease|nr:ABC transporter permease [Bryobacteraceae bacterium]